MCASRQIASAFSARSISSATACIVATEASSTSRSASAWRSWPAARATASRRATRSRAVRSERDSLITALIFLQGSDGPPPCQTDRSGARHKTRPVGPCRLRGAKARPDVCEEPLHLGAAQRRAEVQRACGEYLGAGERLVVRHLRRPPRAEEIRNV